MRRSQSSTSFLAAAAPRDDHPKAWMGKRELKRQLRSREKQASASGNGLFSCCFHGQFLAPAPTPFRNVSAAILQYWDAAADEHFAPDSDSSNEDVVDRTHLWPNTRHPDQEQSTSPATVSHDNGSCQSTPPPPHNLNKLNPVADMQPAMNDPHTPSSTIKRVAQGNDKVHKISVPKRVTFADNGDGNGGGDGDGNGHGGVGVNGKGMVGMDRGKAGLKTMDCGERRGDAASELFLKILRADMEASRQRAARREAAACGLPLFFSCTPHY